MPNNEDPEIPPGWTGGFDKSNPDFAYPKRDLSSLLMLDNMDNIDLLDRQLAIHWPEFSWESTPGEKDPRRCFQKFAPNISRVGYTNEGRIYSIICPQQGVDSPSLGSINVEVTVTGQRGWVDEDTRTLAADMTVVAKIWFGPGFREKPAIKLLKKILEDAGHALPVSKDKAIVVTTFDPGRPDQKIFPIKEGESTGFDVPDFARHKDEAWSVGNLEVEIGPIEQSPHRIVNDVNELLMDIFNLVSGNMLLSGHVLTWNLWFNHPQLVDRQEWHDHAKKWRASIDADHGSPDGNRTTQRYFDGSPLDIPVELLEVETEKIARFIFKHGSPQARLQAGLRWALRRLRQLPSLLGK